MKLYDAYGREVEPARLREVQAAPTFAGIRNIYSVMHPSVGLTPERLAGILREAEAGDPYQYLELAEEMEEKDLHYLAVLSTRKQSVAQLDMIIRPASSSAEDQSIAALVREVLLEGTLPMESVLFDILDAVGKGFSAVEIIWNTEGRTWLPERLVWRDPRWFMFDWVNGETLLLRSLDGEGESAATAAGGPSHFRSGGRFSESPMQPFTVPLCPYKFIVHIAQAKSGLPVRGGIARAAGWAYLFKNYVLKDWVTFTEVFGQPLRVGKYGPGATENDKRVLLNAVTNIGTDAGAVIPDSMLIEFTEARQSGSAELYESFCSYLDQQVSKAVLGQTLTTEMPRQGGSRAAAEVHQTVRRDIMNADARRLAATITHDLVKPIVDLNCGPRRRYPQFILGLPDDQDVKVFADTISELADRGLRVSQKTVLDKLGLPEPQDGEAVLAPARRTPATGAIAQTWRG
ncbi:MAG TPA: DUF935 domain-containing protein [Candidatus Binataceae bacterium]|nr:DUF935 domain-containing protein [Candidatus Binataceae bacterium]